MDKDRPPGQAAALDDATYHSADSANLDLLRLYAQLNGLSLDARQLAQYFSDPDKPIELAEMVAALHALEFNASVENGRTGQLGAGLLPLIAEGRDGRFLLLGRIEGAEVVVQLAGEDQPRQMTVTEFEAAWTGRWIKAARRTSIQEQNRTELHRFGIGWFWQALRKYRGLMGEVLLASFFIQVFALITPLFFQVVIEGVDASLTLYARRHGSRNGGRCHFRGAADRDAALSLFPYHQSRGRRTGRQAVPPFAAFTLGLFRVASQWRYGGTYA